MTQKGSGKGDDMSELAGCNPTGRFTGLADAYNKGRPGYPEAALDFIVGHCGLGPGSAVVDVGCGTGISARQFARRGLRVIGIEPNGDMRARAEAHPTPAGGQQPSYRPGRAEDTGLADGCADAVVGAQAFHWFETQPALREFHRILNRGGWAVLLWNERDETDPFTAVYGQAIRTVPGAAALEMSRGRAGEPLLHSSLFENGARATFANHQDLDEEALLQRAFSTSYAPREPEPAKRFTLAVREAFARFQNHGRVTLCYETSVYVAQRRMCV
jgi:ubiquinone/menaquinone biosynthesis C-methylase UbiE